MLAPVCENFLDLVAIRLFSSFIVSQAGEVENVAVKTFDQPKQVAHPPRRIVYCRCLQDCMMFQTSFVLQSQASYTRLHCRPPVPIQAHGCLQWSSSPIQASSRRLADTQHADSSSRSSWVQFVQSSCARPAQCSPRRMAPREAQPGLCPDIAAGNE